jgi:hypothetical protein
MRMSSKMSTKMMMSQTYTATELYSPVFSGYLLQYSIINFMNSTVLDENYGINYVAFEVLTAMTMKIFFWDITPCGLVEVRQHFGGTGCLHFQGRRTSRARSRRQAEFATQRHIPEDSFLHSRRRENLIRIGHVGFFIDKYKEGF